MLRHRTDLNLTAEQVATLEKMRSDFQQRVDPKQEELKNTEAEIARLLRENAVDLVRVKAKIEDAERLRAEFRYLRIEALESGKSVLTSEQRDKLENLASSGRGRFRRPHGEAS
jgi:Spy/CpxP family protein refolding chaperone